MKREELLPGLFSFCLLVEVDGLREIVGGDVAAQHNRGLLKQKTGLLGHAGAK